MLKLVANQDFDFNEMSPTQLYDLQLFAAKMSLKERELFYEQILAKVEPGFSNDITHPVWLESDFTDNIWVCNFGVSKRKQINFNIQLDNGQLLSSPNQAELLNTFKYLLCCQTHPRYCGGGQIKLSTCHTKILNCLHLIDGILLRSSYFRLAVHGLALITQDDIIELFVGMCQPIEKGVYDFYERLANYLIEHSIGITSAQIDEAAKKYPAVNRVTYSEELDMTPEELIKARVWLIEQGAYSDRSSRSKANVSKKGELNLAKIKRHLYLNTLSGQFCKFPLPEDLTIKQEERSTEFNRLPVRSNEYSITTRNASRVLEVFRSLHLISGPNFSGLDPTSLDGLSLKVLDDFYDLRSVGRYRTLPAGITFKAVRDAFEFVIPFGDDILTLVSDVLIENSLTKTGKDSKYRYYDESVKNFASENLKNLGVNRWRSEQIVKNPEYKTGSIKIINFHLLRSNAGLLDLYFVLMGGIQFILGVVMARRQAELVELQENCLIPDKDPTLKENRNIGYSLVFDNRKSGDAEEREQLARPILLSGARLIWKLKQFRQKLVKAELVSSDAPLMLTVNGNTNSVLSMSTHHYNNNLDIFCDYFETKTVFAKDGQRLRWYFRQHQLRRFFAMAFFWGSSFDGFDTLRWFLGHTDVEHLWHYITESTPGVVLRGVKADTLVHGLNSSKIEGIEKLRELLKQRFAVQDIQIQALEDVIEDLQDDVIEGHVNTIPPLNDLCKEINDDVDLLLKEGVIDLEPTFCTVKDGDGNDLQIINLVLIVKENIDAY